MTRTRRCTGSMWTWPKEVTIVAWGMKPPRKKVSCCLCFSFQMFSLMLWPNSDSYFIAIVLSLEYPQAMCHLPNGASFDEPSEIMFHMDVTTQSFNLQHMLPNLCCQQQAFLVQKFLEVVPTGWLRSQFLVLHLSQSLRVSFIPGATSMTAWRTKTCATVGCSPGSVALFLGELRVVEIDMDMVFFCPREQQFQQLQQSIVNSKQSIQIIVNTY